ncbi:MAG: sigma 54-interacting transcriptional regulator, partial [Verrucomicrobiae bacterium]|nr:sigma 54-interacting transcriptional regulator [Verrucomicrobiae bacterium]MDW7980370.1 sigma 54-interacting transcriptional regulator [Verrucomicrobiales bacterium]
MASHHIESEPTARELRLLYEVSRRLDESLDLQVVLPPVLEALARYMDMNYGTLTILHRDTGQIMIEAAHGLTPAQAQRVRYRVGEGVTGRVIQTGEPIIIPRKSESPLVLDRTGRGKRPDTAFICVPIKIGQEVAGALSVDTPSKPDAELRNDARLLCIVASMIAQAVQLRRAALEEQERLADENRRLRGELRERFRPANMIGVSHEIRQVFDQIAQVARTNATVLICGETGTGKELVAQAIHYNSDRADGPFVRVHCAALPEALVESELFGHVRGAFTGAVRDRKGRFELADGGTLFLDEVGDVPPSIQVKLLRVLQEQEFERVGDTRTIRVNVRVIAATHRDLPSMIATGRFREDLYYRLNVFPIHIPPLRKRVADILPLAEHFLNLYARQHNKPARMFSAEVRRKLLAYPWPGNVRELENTVERAVLICPGQTILVEHLPPALQAIEEPDTEPGEGLAAQVAALERRLILEALHNTGGNVAAAARALRTTPRILAYKIRK